MAAHATSAVAGGIAADGVDITAAEAMGTVTAGGDMTTAAVATATAVRMPIATSRASIVAEGSTRERGPAAAMATVEAISTAATAEGITPAYDRDRVTVDI